MKTKKRNLNQEPSLYKKKMNTRTMNSRNTNDSVPGLSASSLASKSSPNTRAKTNCVIKSHPDPYAFSKMDEEEKIPLKKIKITEKEGKEVGVNTSSFSTMTEPEYLGPCEPGTSIELQGIVWLETTTGLLVINVTWRGRTYVGTLMDSTKYEFTPTFSQENLGKFESPQNRPTRGKKRQVGNPGNYFSLRSNNIRHSSRLNESVNSPSADNAIKKLSTRQTNNLINYFDSTNQSATASASGDSDTDKNSYSKFSISSSKTRSVTRSITKLNKAALRDTNSNSADNGNGDLVRCTRINCFKRFVDMTAYQYHVQRTHDVHDKTDESTDTYGDNKTEYDHISKNNCIKIESVVTKDKDRHENGNEPHTQDGATAFKSLNCKLNNIVSKEVKSKIDSFEFNSDSETEKNQNTMISFNYSENKGDLKISESELLNDTESIKSFIKSENLSPEFPELSITLPKVSDTSTSDGVQSTNSSSITDVYPCSNDKLASLLSGCTTPSSKPLLSSVKSVSQTLPVSISTAVMISHSTSVNRTVSAPTVSIPVELVTTQNNVTSTAISCPTLIKPKPNQNPITSLIHSSQNRKFKSSKSFSQQNGVLEPFQIPSSSPIILKKRPLVPLKVAVNQNASSNVNRMYSMSSQINVSSSNSSRQIRSSSISPVTPILPATSTTNHVTSSVISTASTTGSSTNCSANNIFHNGQLAMRRPSGTSNLTTGSGLSTLVNLKPIQPKPKNPQFPVPITTGQHGLNTSSFSTSQSIAQSAAGLSSIHVSHQRQILPSPISKSDTTANAEDSLIHKIESLKTSLIKRKRRKPEKKIRINFHESNRFKKFSFNAIQPKHVTSKNSSEEFCLTNDKYKTDEENSHSPGYSDLSETNDTPAPILEKEIDLKTGECDKLVICTDFDSISIYRHNSSSSDNYDDPKDLSNKPPALMPAVLSSDLVNGSTNELDYRDVKPRPSRKKTLVNKKTHKLKEVAKGKMNVDKLVGSEWINVSCSRSNNLATPPNRKSFQLSSAVQQTLSSAPLLSPQSSVMSLAARDYSTTDQNSNFLSVSRSSITSAVNARSAKINYRDHEKANRNKVESPFQSAHTFSENSNKVRSKQTTPSPNNNGKFSVQALTSTQDIVSRSLSFSTSSSVSTIIPNSKLSNALFKN